MKLISHNYNRKQIFLYFRLCNNIIKVGFTIQSKQLFLFVKYFYEDFFHFICYVKAEENMKMLYPSPSDDCNYLKNPKDIVPSIDFKQIKECLIKYIGI